MPDPDPVGGDPPTISVPDVRDYAKINGELRERLDAGHAHVILSGAAGQRLLAAGLRGSWNAVVEISGDAGPEMAADLDAPGLIVALSGSAGDGAARGLRAGRVVIAGDAGPAAGYTQRGGTIVVAGSCGPRAGLDGSGGLLVVGRSAGRLAAERRSGGLVAVIGGEAGPHAGHGLRGGRFAGAADTLPMDRSAIAAEARALGPWCPPALRRFVQGD